MLTMTFIGASRDAWGYLTRSIAEEHAQDRAQGKAAYYMANGTPPGTWVGTGLGALGLQADSEVKEEHLRHLFGEGVHPHTQVALGRKYETPASVEERVAARYSDALQTTSGMSPDELAALHDQITLEEIAKPTRQSVAGFEFVFSPPKSVSSWWALASPEMKDDIRKAHHAAIAATLTKLESDIVRTRLGADGIAQAEVKGVSAAMFDHWDSREGDPQLHTHMLISNRVQGEDGRWRTIDSRWSLSPAVATASSYYDTVLMDELSNRFGVEWTVQDILEDPERYKRWRKKEGLPDSPASRMQFALDRGTSPRSIKWQVVGIPQDLNNLFSTRSKQLVAHKDRLIEEFRRKFGRMPSDATIIRMRQAATTRTRRAKQQQSLQSLTSTWREKAAKLVGDTFLFADRIADAGTKRRDNLPLWSFRHDDVHEDQLTEATDLVLHGLAVTRSTWQRTNAEASALRAIAHWRFRSAEDRNIVASRIVERVIEQAIPLTPANELHAPSRFRTRDGDSMFRPKSRDLFTTTQVWDAEERLLEAGRTTTAATVTAPTVDALLLAPTQAEGRILSDDQAAAVQNITTSGRLVDVLVGPAGAGKTTSLEKLLEIWETEHGAGSVRGLAPTARAAEVLAESLGIETENTAKWLHETSQGTTQKDGFNFTLNDGDLLIIDEASIAGTVALDTLRQQAQDANAKLLLVGDWAQLASIDAGGAFGLLALDRDDVPELVNLHRFKAEWEADASKLLRLGKTSGLTPYFENDRVTTGMTETLIHDAVEAWKLDEATLNDKGDATRTSLLIAPTNDVVEELNDIARTWRIEQGLVDATLTGDIASGVASPGDRIVTRQNARTLRTDRDRWVKNNDEWVVTDIARNGDIVASSGEEHVTLPASYCRDHVQLAYATTAHRSQGRTVDTAHTIVDSSASRETFYVAMTRGKLSNRAYVVSDEDQQLGDKAATGMSLTPRELLERVVLKRGGDIAAHDTRQAEADRIGSVRQLAAEHQTLIADQLEQAYLPVLTDLDLIDANSPDSPYLGPVLANLRRVDQAGESVPDTITRLLTSRDLGDARDVLAVLHYRLGSHLDRAGAHPPEYVAGIIERAPEFGDPDFERALREREHAIQLRAELLVDQAIAHQEPWVKELGPVDPGAEIEWRQRAVTVACYRDLYGVDTDDALGRGDSSGINREHDRAIAAAALRDTGHITFAPAHPPAAVTLPTQATQSQAPGI